MRSVQIIFMKIDGVYKIPLSTYNLDMVISVTSISLLSNELCTSVAFRNFNILCGIDVTNQKLYHSAYLIYSVQAISTRIDGAFEIPISTSNPHMDISVTSICPLE